MNIWEVKFKERKNKESAFFTSNSSAEKFIISIVKEGIYKISRPIKHEVEKRKTDIVKFLNRDNGLS